MKLRAISSGIHATLLFAAMTGAAHAHHAMDYALPATPFEGLLSGLGHPVIGLDHLLFIIGAGVAAARFDRGAALPLVFVVASVLAAGLRYLGPAVPAGEMLVAGSLVVLGALMLLARGPGRGILAVVFLAAGAVHGNALAEAIVGAERAPLAAYLAGLAVIQCVIALAAWGAARRLSAHRPNLPLQRLAGAVVGIAGLAFAGMAAL